MNRIVAVVVRHWIPLVSLNISLLTAICLIVVKTPKVWTANAELILPNKTSDLNANLGTLGNLTGGGVVFSQQLNPLKILSSILLSNDTLVQAQMSDPEKALYPRLSTYRGLFKVSPQGETTVISLSADGSSQEIARERLDAWIVAFQQRLNKLRAEDATQRGEFMQKELNQARQNLLRTQTALTEFKSFSNLVSSEDQTRELVASINTLTTAQAQVMAEFQASEAQLTRLSTRLGLTPDQAIRSLRLKENKDYQFVRQKLSEVEAELVKDKILYTDEHPRIQHLRSQQNELRRELENYIAQAAGKAELNTSIGDDSGTLIQQLALTESQASALQQRARQLQSQVSSLNERLRSLPAAQSRLIELQRQYNTADGVYNGLVAKVQEARLNAFSTYPNVQTLDQPSVDSHPSGSKRKAIVLGGLLASAFGSIALMLFLEKRNPLLSLTDLQLLDITVLGNIPRHKNAVEAINSKSKTSLGSETLIAFQKLATTVSTMRLYNHCLMISSATAGEGKTTVTLGLASALATLGFRILVVDGDFRKAELSQRLGYSQTKMSGSKLVPIKVRRNLDLLPTTPQGDEVIEFIARGGFEKFLAIAQASGDYDYVLVDSAPIALTSEAALMTAATRNVLLVTCLGTSSRHPFDNTIEQLSRHKAQIVGLVINGAQIRTEGDLYGHSKAKVSI